MSGDRSAALASRRALLGAVAALAAPCPAWARAPDPLRLGIVLPGGAEQAALARIGAEIAGELLARRARPVSLRFAEAAGGADHVTRITTRLVDEGAEIILAGCGDATTEAALAVAERREVPIIAATAIAPALGDRGARLLIRTSPTASQLVGRGLGLLRDLCATAGLALPQQPVLVHAETAEGRLIRSTLAAILPGAGLPLTRQAEIPVGADGVVGEVQRAAFIAALRAAEPDIVLLAAPPAAAGSVLMAIAASGLSLSGIASFGIVGLAAREIVALPEKAGECHVTFSPWPDPASAVTAEVRALYNRGAPSLPFSLAQGELGLMVDAVLLAGEAGARHPSARGQALATALRGGVLVQKMMRGPPMRFDARGQNIAMPSVALQNQGGRPVVILPREGAEAAPIWPNPLYQKS